MAIDNTEIAQVPLVALIIPLIIMGVIFAGLVQLATEFFKEPPRGSGIVYLPSPLSAKIEEAFCKRKDNMRYFRDGPTVVEYRTVEKKFEGEDTQVNKLIDLGGK